MKNLNRWVGIGALAVATLWVGACAAAGGGSCLTKSQLTGTWAPECTSGASCEQITFDDQGGVFYEYWNAAVGNTESSGSSDIACPNVTVTLTAGYWSGDTYTFTIGNGVLLKDNVTWNRCNGRCY